LKIDRLSLTSVILQLKKVIQLHRNIMERRFKETGVYPSQHRILILISSHANVSQKEIAKRLYVSTATIAVSVKKLEKGGYITRFTDQDDNRLNKLCLTEKGKSVVRKSYEFFDTVEVQMFRGFTNEELSIIKQRLERMYNNLSQISTEEDRRERKD
jgi:DNA-binding MarR family transcriptional regulator